MLPNWLVRAWSMYGFVHGQAMPDSHSLHINQGRAMPDSISSPTLKSQVGRCLTHRFDTHALGFGMWPLVIGLLQTGLIQHAFVYVYWAQKIIPGITASILSHAAMLIFSVS